MGSLHFKGKGWHRENHNAPRVIRLIYGRGLYSYSCKKKTENVTFAFSFNNNKVVSPIMFNFKFEYKKCLKMVSLSRKCKQDQGCMDG